MSLSDYLLSDLTTFFDTNEFAVSAIYNGKEFGTKTVKVIFDNEDGQVDLADGQVIDSRPEVMAIATDFPNIANGHTLHISGTTYNVKEFYRDQKGTMRIVLGVD